VRVRLLKLRNFSDDPSSPEFKNEPTWLLHFLALFNCDSIPKILFARTANISTRWSNDGELDRGYLNCLHLVHPKFEQVFKVGLRRRPWSESFINNENRKRYLESLDEDAATGGLKISTQKSQLIILTIVASAFPEPVCIIFRAVAPF
jgi:hypothetical protein